MSYFSTDISTERAFLVGVSLRGSDELLSVDDSLRELKLLADTAGMEVVGSATQTLNKIESATFIGSGKVQEIQESLDQLDAKVVIFDDELSPRHQRELEKRLGEQIKVLDRSALILDIFAQHAHTREGALQVELAQYEYRLPRLTRQWTHLARQAGGGGSRSGNAGVGLRGPGETQLEVDRREISRKIAKLKADLEQVRQHRAQHRSQRAKKGIPVIALVGYTNAGKSTLINALTESGVLAADQLFATLDPTTRQLVLPSNREALVTDTVGFIQKLPTTLIAAFRATLEEITEADLLIHIVDASHPNVVQQIEIVEDTLAEIDVPRMPKILAWNKMDRVSDSTIDEEQEKVASLREEYAAEVRISAKVGTGIDALLDVIDHTLGDMLRSTRLLISYEHGDIVSQLYRQGQVISQEHTPEGMILDVQLPEEFIERYAKYKVGE